MTFHAQRYFTPVSILVIQIFGKVVPLEKCQAAVGQQLLGRQLICRILDDEQV
jgi:hypothetical protein